MVKTNLNKLDVLIIENDVNTQKSLTTLLSSKIETITIENNYAEGYTKLKELSPNILLININLPNIIESITEIQKASPNLIIILLGEINDSELIRKLFFLGIEHIVPYPLDDTILLKKIDKIQKNFLLQSTIDQQSQKIEKYLHFIEKNLTQKQSKENEENTQTLETSFYEQIEFLCNIGTWKHNHVSNKLSWSKQMYHILELPIDSKPSYESFLSCIHIEDRGSVDKAHKESLLVNDSFNIDYTLIGDNKELKLINESIQTIFDEKNNPLYTFGVIQDINKYKTLYSSLEKNEEIMISQSKFATMGEMIGMIMHQWRQPITTISMSVNNLLVDIELEMLEAQAVKKSALTITEQTQYLSKTIEDFRSFFKSVKQVEEISMKYIFNETSKIMGTSLHNKEIDFQLKFDENLTIKTYSRELLQVLINIIKNAKDALVDKEISHKYIKVEIIDSNENIIITISDNAGGIPEKIIDNIFDAYFTTKGEDIGTGLGLYMSKTIIDKHLKGELKVENQDDGARFIIQLPKTLEER